MKFISLEHSPRLNMSFAERYLKIFSLNTSSGMESIPSILFIENTKLVELVSSRYSYSVKLSKCNNQLNSSSIQFFEIKTKHDFYVQQHNDKLGKKIMLFRLNSRLFLNNIIKDIIFKNILVRKLRENLL